MKFLFSIFFLLSSFSAMASSANSVRCTKTEAVMDRKNTFQITLFPVASYSPNFFPIAAMYEQVNFDTGLTSLGKPLDMGWLMPFSYVDTTGESGLPIGQSLCGAKGGMLLVEGNPPFNKMADCTVETRDNMPKTFEQIVTCKSKKSDNQGSLTMRVDAENGNVTATCYQSISRVLKAVSYSGMSCEVK